MIQEPGEPWHVIGAEDVGAGGVEHDDRQQRDPQPAGGNQDVFPSRLQRGVGAIDRDQQRRDDRRQFDRHPQRPEVRRDRDQQHAPPEQVQQRVIAFGERREPGMGLVDGEISDREHPSDRVQQPGAKQEYRAEGVHPQPAAGTVSTRPCSTVIAIVITRPSEIKPASIVTARASRQPSANVATTATSGTASSA